MRVPPSGRAADGGDRGAVGAITEFAFLADDHRAVPSPDSASQAANLPYLRLTERFDAVYSGITHLCTKIDAMMHGASPAIIASDAAAMSEIPVATAVSCVERDQFM